MNKEQIQKAIKTAIENKAKEKGPYVNLPMETILLFFSIKYKQNWEDIMHALAVQETVDFEAAAKLQKDFGRENYITIIDDKFYPNEFKLVNKPPFVVFKDDSKNANTYKRIGV